MTNDAMSPLFLAAVEATEEAVYNSMFKATTMTGNGHEVQALPIKKTVEILKEHRVLKKGAVPVGQGQPTNQCNGLPLMLSSSECGNVPIPVQFGRQNLIVSRNGSDAAASKSAL